MKKAALYLIVILICSLRLSIPQEDDKVGINIIYPTSNEIIEINGKSVFLLGQIDKQNAQLKINDVEANIDADGAFLCYCPVVLFEDAGMTKGKFVFEVISNNKTVEVEKIYKVKLPPPQLPESELTIDKNWRISPNEDLSIRFNDLIEVEARATPGSKLSFSIDGLTGTFPMVETVIEQKYLLGDAIFGDGFKGVDNRIDGIYRGAVRINKELKNAKIIITAEKNGFPSVKAAAKGTITTLNDNIPLVIQTKSEPNLVIGRYGPGLGYNLFMEEGIKLEVMQKQGGWYKARLGSAQHIYLSENSVSILQAGTPPPNGVVSVMRVEETDRSVGIEIGLSERLPYKIVQHNNPQMLEILIYNITSDIDWIHYNRSSDFVKEVKWTQPLDGALKIDVFINQKTHWGYKSVYDGSVLKININKPAKKNSTFLFWSNQLKGRRIVLDPGHTPDAGAVGPRGVREKDVNMQITMKLKGMLENSGADVFLTHDGTKGLNLRERKAAVNSHNPEISVSIHNNAVPQGVNPLVHNGISAYYYYPQAKPLAELIYKSLLDNIDLNDFGFYWDNLYMCRIPESISMLVEPAFMSVPEQERLLTEDWFQEKIAKSIFMAIEKFYEEYSE